MFEILKLATEASHTDSVRHTPGRPTELAWDALHCPMCIVKPKINLFGSGTNTPKIMELCKTHIFWSLVPFIQVNLTSPFPSQRADASIYLKKGQRDCSVTPNVTGCAAKH
jgi:hypothetical protein